MSRKLMYEEWDKRTSSGQNPHVSKDWFGVSMRKGNSEYDEMAARHRAAKEKEQRDKITADARNKSWGASRNNKSRKGIFESLNKIFKI